MKLLRRTYLIFFAASVMTPMLQSCFTGIESTPRISDKEVRRHQAALPADRSTALADSLPCTPFGSWNPGRRFLVTDPRAGMLLERQPALSPGDTLTYAGYEETTSLSGEPAVNIFFTLGDDTFRYPVATSLTLLAGSSSACPPFTIDIADVQATSRLLAGKETYVLTPLRVDSVSTPIANGRRYVPVRIARVLPGNYLYPLCVEIVDADGRHEFVAMTYGKGRMGARRFDSLFSFTNPRLLHPEIADDTWEKITRSEVAEGMTTDECRLSIGIPSDVRRGQNGTSWFERWTFPSGAYLIFEDGLLKTFRL